MIRKMPRAARRSRRRGGPCPPVPPTCQTPPSADRSLRTVREFSLRRPACLFFIFQIAVILILGALGVPGFALPGRDGSPVSGGQRLTLRGRIDCCDARELYTVLVVRDALPGRIRAGVSGRMELPVGTPVELTGEPEQIQGPENPGQFDQALYYATQGIRWQMKRPEVRVIAEDGTAVPARTPPERWFDAVREILREARDRCTGRIRSVYPPEEAEILCAVLTGDRSGLQEEEKGLWRSGGIMHMLSISGLHLSVLGMGLFELLLMAGTGVRVSGILSSVAMLLFTLFTGGAVPTVRALVMFLLMVGAKLAGRTYDAPTALSFTGSLILLGNPLYLFFSGFRMSFAAVLICTVFGRRGKLTTAVMLYMWMLPLVMGTYSEIPIYSVAVNLAAVPALPVILVSGALGALLGAAGDAGGLPGGLPAVPAVCVLRGLRRLLRLCGSLPCSEVVTGSPSLPRTLLYFSVLAAFCLLMKRLRLYRRRFFLYLLIPLLILIPGFRVRRGLTLTFLSVGQGDGIVLELPDGRNLMIDAGSSSVDRVGEYRVIPFLKSRGISRLHYIFATHADEDHVNGIREILESGEIRAETLVLPSLKNRSTPYNGLAALAGRAGARVLTAARGDRFEFGEVGIDVVGPDPAEETDTEDPNGQCLVMSLRFREFDALFTGDVEGGGERSLIEEMRGSRRTYEVLKVAHHGSPNSTPAEFLDIVRPAVSVISCGLNNIYHHPGEALLDRLDAAGTEIFRTDLDGAVTVRTDGRRCRVRGYRRRQKRP